MLWKTAAQRLLKPLQLANGRISWEATVALGPRRSYSEHQQSLPRFPVPPLNQTLNKYLQVIQPLVKNDQYTNTQKLVKDFGKTGGVGEKLQKLLEEKANNTINWLEDWWLKIAYLEYRLPCAIHVNPGIMLPIQNFKDKHGQLSFAARIVAGVLDYKTMVDEQKLPVEYLGKEPLCMSQYYKILNGCRVPGPTRDMTQVYPPDQYASTRHICVMHNNHIFSVDVYGSNGKPLSVDQIRQQLENLVEDSQTTAPAIGALTSDHRDTWGKVYQKLRSDETNKASLDEIHHSIFVLCLDQSIPHSSPDEFPSVVLNQTNHGGGTKWNSCNRWFDKIIQIIVGNDGALGGNYEHSTAEGPPILALLDHAMDLTKVDYSDQKPNEGMKSPRRLKFNLTPEIEQYIENSKKNFDVLIDDLDMIRFSFREFGKEMIKSHKLSPDAFIQVSLQLAFYRLYGHSTATYESGSLRRFQHGRTEVIRAASVTSHRFCENMDRKIDPAEKVDLLREAVVAHRNYTNEVVAGQGVDRHLTGLNLLSKENDMKIPELFSDPVYASTQHWRLSTSQVASKYDTLLGFAPVVPDGYGVCYNPMKEGINFNISSWRSSSDTDTQGLKKSLHDALCDSMDLLGQTQSAKL